MKSIFLRQSVKLWSERRSTILSQWTQERTNTNHSEKSGLRKTDWWCGVHKKHNISYPPCALDLSYKLVRFGRHMPGNSSHLGNWLAVDLCRNT